MDSVRAGGRSYSDPDLVALIRASGGLLDPRSIILTQARKLNQLYRSFDSSDAPFERLKHIASLCGLDVLPMNLDRRVKERRDAVIFLNGNARGKKGQIFYNPDRPTGRVHFSIAHEITHTFVPPTSGGARFREMLDVESREANELERLCDLGASEILMPIEDFRKEAKDLWSIAKVPDLMNQFGSSFEATTFRLASAHQGVAAAGLLKFRRRKEEERALQCHEAALKQERLFPTPMSGKLATIPAPRYRRQSFHTSDGFPVKAVVHWNKSFEDGSVVYTAPEKLCLVSSREALPSGDKRLGILEAIVAPFQRPDADLRHPDVLFLWLRA